MAEMSEEQLASIISSEITDSINHFDSEYSADRLRAMDMYLGQPIGNEIEGRSQVVLTEVADCVDQIMPSLMRIFTASDKYVRFSPKTAEDVERADMMTDYVNHIINSDNDGYKIFYDDSHWTLEGASHFGKKIQNHKKLFLVIMVYQNGI